MSQTDADNTTKNHSLHKRKSDDLPAPPLHLENMAAKHSYQEISAGDTGESSSSCFGKCLNRLRLEFFCCLLMFSWVLIEISSTSMILDKVCLVHYNYSQEICSNLDNHTKIKSTVEKMATNYQLAHSLIQTAPAVLVSCFVGPWSDKYGRKIPVLIAITGMILDTLGSTVCAYFLYSKVEFYLIPAVFTGCSGGVVSFLTIIYSYASDVTPKERRTMKYAFVEMAVGLSQPLGAAAGGWIYKFWGYPAVFMISACGLTLSFFLVVFFLPETRGQDNNDSLKMKLKNLFTLETLKDGFNTTLKQRPNQGRKQILLLIISTCVIVVATNSIGDVNYFFVHHEFNWNNTKYSTFKAIYTIINIVILIMVVPAMKYFRTGDPTLGLCGTTSILLKYVGFGLTFQKPTIYHLANLLGCLAGCASLAGRSRISKIVPNEDLGKVFTFVATAESLLPVIATILITQAFTASLDIYPAMPYIILAICLLLPISVFAWLTRLPNTISAYTDMDKENNGEIPKSNDP